MVLEGIILDFVKKLYAEMQKDHEQMKDRLDALENTVREIKADLRENFKSMNKELESLQEEILYIKYYI